MNAILDKTQNAVPTTQPAEGLPGRLLRAVGTHNLSLLIALACLLAIFGGLYDTKLAQQENSSGATDNIIVRTNKLTGEVCERYEMETIWTCK